MTNGDEKTNDILENIVLKNSFITEEYINFEISDELSPKPVANYREENVIEEVERITQQNNQDNTSQDSVVSGATDSGLCTASQNSQVSSPYPNLNQKNESVPQDLECHHKALEELTIRLVEGTSFGNSFINSPNNEDADSIVEQKLEENSTINDQTEVNFGKFSDFHSSLVIEEEIPQSVILNDHIPIIEEKTENVQDSVNITSYKDSFDEDCDFGDFTDFQSGSVEVEQNSKSYEEPITKNISNLCDIDKTQDSSIGKISTEEDCDFGDFANFNSESQNNETTQPSSINFPAFEKDSSSSFADFNEAIGTENNLQQSKDWPNESEFTFENDTSDNLNDDFNDFESALPSISTQPINSKQVNNLIYFIYIFLS